MLASLGSLFLSVYKRLTFLKKNNYAGLMLLSGGTMLQLTEDAENDRFKATIKSSVVSKLALTLFKWPAPISAPSSC